MVGLQGPGLPRRYPPPTTTKVNDETTLVPLGCADVRWSPLVPTAPYAKERKLSNNTWTVVARRGQRHKTKALSSASVVKQGTPIMILLLSCKQKPPLATTIK